VPHHLADPLMAEAAGHEVPEVLWSWMLLAGHPDRLAIGLDSPPPRARRIGGPRLLAIGPLHDGRLRATWESRAVPNRNTIGELNRLLFFLVVPKHGSAAT